MSLGLRPAEKTYEQLKALAASGATGLARDAQRELRERARRSLEAAVAKGQVRP